MRTRNIMVYRERMRQVVRVLCEVKEQGRLFSLSNWGTDDPISIKHFILDGTIPEGSCGTVACAIGHVGLDPWFNRRHFMLEKYNKCEAEPTFRVNGRKYKYRAWYAVRKFFNLSYDDSENMFMERYYDDGYTIDDVIARVNEYISSTYGAEYVVA